MNVYEMADKQLNRLDDLMREGAICEVRYQEMCNEVLNCTTECASQTDRGGEQPNEVGLVQSPDNAATSRNTELNDNHTSNILRVQRGELFEDETGKCWVSSRISAKTLIK